MKKNKLENHNDLGAGIDRKRLADVKKRFVKLNRQRLSRIRTSLSEHQRIFTDILTLSIHENHPILPGYVSKEVPSGISDYTPGKIAIRAAKKLAKSFTLKKRAQMRTEILSIFIMGSSGTIGHSGESDFDVWICHRKTLNKKSLALLQQKLNLISRWATTIKLEAHFFLMDEDYFRSHTSAPMDKESAGSSQHYLLLDEFYRTAVLLAGRHPLWWMVPVEDNVNYENYTELLLTKRYLKKSDWIDFGPIAEIPANEFFGAALWQVYKGIDSPYKSVLKIALMEVYASMHPYVSPLCEDYKQLVYQDENPDPSRIDPYLLMYRKVESYLTDLKDYKRLELIRRCFYIKVSIRISNPPLTAAYGWRRELMSDLVRQWGWEKDQLLQLDSRNSWKINRVISERRKLVHELTNSYKFLSNFARQNNAISRISQQDINLLGRKLYAAFERRAGKIDFINPNIAPNLHEEFLTFQYFSTSKNMNTWLLYKDHVEFRDSEYHSSIKRSTSLLELISWAYLNGLMNRHTKIQLNAGKSNIEHNELKQVCNGIIQAFPLKLRTVNENAYDDVAQSLFNIVVVNLGNDPLGEFTRRGLQLISNRTDSLNYGNQHLNLAVSFDLLNLNSWGEVSHTNFTGKDAIIGSLTAWLQNLPPNIKHRPKLVIQSYCKTRAQPIKDRISDLWNDITEAWYSNPNCFRYLISAANQTILFEALDGEISTKTFNTKKAMLSELKSAFTSFSNLCIDKNCLTETPLPKIFNTNTKNETQLFYHVNNETAEIWIVDETGALFYQKQQFHDLVTLLNPYLRFLQSVSFRQSAIDNLSEPNDLKLFELTSSKSKGKTVWLVKEQDINDEANLVNYYNIQVIASEDHRGKIFYTYYCNDIEFSALEYGDNLLSAVAHQIIMHRNNDDRYPVYITDLDISAINPLHRQITCQYLEIKKRLEDDLYKELNA